MKSFVIHLTARVDRSKYLNALAAVLPDLEIVPGQTPQWERDRDARAVRGCSLAHLDCVRHQLKPTSPVLILEDDAVAHPAGIAAWNPDHIPADAGIVLLGGDTIELGEPDTHGFREVKPPFYGSHAVLYLPVLRDTAWLLEAYSALARRRVGDNLCYESIILMALQGTGLKVYRPEVLPFVTADSFSDREGKDMGARAVAVDLRPSSV